MQLGAGAQIPIRRNDTRVSKKKNQTWQKNNFQALIALGST